MSQLFGGIEAGGTKFICIVASGPDRIVEQARIPTTTPEETLRKTVEFFQPFVTARQVDSIGVACFGPVDLNPDSPTYGHITSTPKPHWSNTDVRGVIQRALRVEVAFDNDVNGAALGEFKWGANRGCDPSLYLTIGTGIGGGYILNGRPLAGMLAPEMGHIRIPHDRARDPFPGNCPFHRDCFEGLANGPAIQARFGSRGEAIPDDDPFWDVEAEYVAAALVNYILTLSPKRIVLGGGVMRREYLFPKIRRNVQALLNGYVVHPNVLADVDGYIVPPALGHLSGSLGAVALAQTG
ncbi:MAG: ROK family protein [Anaerolineae bacterium]|nr:putative fructokinase [Anaerolineales bacterium]MCC7512886.1 ROK family protein [Anaerolineae bacterium]